MDVMEGARSAPEPGKGRAKAKQLAEDAERYLVLEPGKLAARLKQMEAQMYQHARDLEFEKAGQIRDEMQRLKALSLPIQCRAGRPDRGPTRRGGCPEPVPSLQCPLSGD